MKTESTEVLILHGGSLDLVEDLKEFLGGLGISAATVLDQPSQSKPQMARVDDRIKQCKLAIVVASFDEETANSRSPRPNVIHELTLCQKYKSKDTIVFQEKRNGLTADIGSNFQGHLVILQFERTGLQKTFTQLLGELRTRGMFLPASASSLKTMPTNVVIGRDLNDFLDKMDVLWASFDQAYKKIHRDDHKTLMHYSDTLDAFFICYWNVFNQMIRKKAPPGDLRIVADQQYKRSQELLEKVWKDAADALMEHANRLRGDSRHKPAPSLLASLQSADHSLRDARKAGKIETRIDTYSQAAETLDLFIKRAETGT
jgi:hypothetical protein